MDSKRNIDIFKAITEHLEIDEFFTGDFGVRGGGLDIESVPESLNDAKPSGNIPSQPESADMAADDLSGGVTEQYHVQDQKLTVQEAQSGLEQNDPDEHAAIIETTESIQKEGLLVKDKTDIKKELEKVAKDVAKCRACELGYSRLNSVPGEGNSNARIVFVGEAPGADEDKTGRPFVGRAGQLLTNIINAMGLKREDVFICNTLKCRPPENRDPKVSEKAACRHFLIKQLELIKPEIIVALGSHAAKELLNSDAAIGQLRGKFHEYYTSEGGKPIKVMPTYHPSYLLRNYNYDSRKRVWEDMQKVLKELGLPLPKKAKQPE